MAINTQIHDRVATPSEDMKEYAFNFGMDNRERAWICTSFDTWERNPFYSGPAMAHPEEEL